MATTWSKDLGGIVVLPWAIADDNRHRVDKLGLPLEKKQDSYQDATMAVHASAKIKKEVEKNTKLLAIRCLSRREITPTFA